MTDKKDDQMAEDPPENRGRGEPLIYTRTTRRDVAKDLLVAYKWPITIAVTLLLVAILAGVVPLPSLDDVPPEAWSLLWYGGLGLLPGIPAAYYLYRRWYTVTGQEVWDLDPVTDAHRHVRIGTELWDDLVVRSPWGEVVGRQELHHCTINGRSGYEMMDLRIESDGTPVCVATMMGEASTSMLRTYRQAMVYTRRILSRKASRVMMQEANREPIAREVAEKVVTWQIRTGREMGTPGAEEIENVVQETLDEMGLGDPLRNDDLDPEADEWRPGQLDRDDDRDDRDGGAQLGESQSGPITNGHGGAK